MQSTKKTVVRQRLPPLISEMGWEFEEDERENLLRRMCHTLTSKKMCVVLVVLTLILILTSTLIWMSFESNTKLLAELQAQLGASSSMLDNTTVSTTSVDYHDSIAGVANDPRWYDVGRLVEKLMEAIASGLLTRRS